MHTPKIDIMNWFDILVIIVLIAACIKGYISGLIMQLAILAGVVLGAIFAGILSGYIAPKLIEWTNTPANFIGSLSYIISFTIIIVALIFLGKMLQSMIKAVKMNTFNRLAGAVFCSATCLVLLSVLLNVIVEFDDNKKWIKEDVREDSKAYPVVKEVSPIVVPYLKFDWFNTGIQEEKEKKPENSGFNIHMA